MAKDAQEERSGQATKRSKALRSLGCHESLQLAMHTLNQYRGTIVACEYGVPSNLLGTDSIDALKGTVTDAIVEVVRSQPLLQVGVRGEDRRSPVFVPLSTLDLQNHIEWVSLEDAAQLQPRFLDMMRSQLDAKYTHLETRPGWRVCVLHAPGERTMRIIYVWNHVHHDGMGGKIFHQQLFRSLVQSADKQTTHKAQHGQQPWILQLPDTSGKIPPTPEKLCSWPVSMPFLVKALWKEVKPYAIFPAREVHATWAPVRASPYATRASTFSIDNKKLQRIRERCRQCNTTITGLLHALVFVSLTSSVPSAKGFACRTPYDLRRFLPARASNFPWLVPKETMCNYVSVLEHEFDEELTAAIRSKTGKEAESSAAWKDVSEIAWPVAARIRHELEGKLNSGVKNDLLSVMRFCLDWRSFQKDEAKKPRYLSWVVTNLGVLDGGGEGSGWSIRQAELALSAEVTSAAVNVAVVTVKDESMCVTCTWQECVVEAQIGDRLLLDLEGWLNQLGA